MWSLFCCTPLSFAVSLVRRALPVGAVDYILRSAASRFVHIGFDCSFTGSDAFMSEPLDRQMHRFYQDASIWCSRVVGFV